MPKVFLSYSSRDSDFAELAKLKLEASGIEVWLDQGTLRPGEEWRNAIEEGINSSDALIVVLSPNSSTSSYVTFEWAYAFGKEKKIIPVLIQEAEIHPRLQLLQHLNFTDPRRRNWKDLAKELQGGGGLLPIKTVKEETAEREHEQEKRLVREYEEAKTLILGHLSRTGHTRVSFDTVRKSIDPAYTDEFLMEVIRRNRPIFRRASVRGKGPGISTEVQ